MVSHRLAIFVLFLSACAAPMAKLARPSWSTQASTDVDCSTWLERALDDHSQSTWRLRAARRAYLCMDSSGKDPSGALLISLRLGVDEPHTLELAERYLSDTSKAFRPDVFKPFLGQSARMDAAVLFATAMRARGEERDRLLKATVARDPSGARGRRAMLLLGKEAESDESKVRWLRRALQPQPGPWSSFGHSEFAGLSAAAKDLEALCSKLKDRDCLRFARRRHQEIER